MDSEQKLTDDISIEVKREAGCQVEATVTLGPESATKAYNQAITAVKKQVSLPGFRKGRAPDRMILDHFKKQVDDEFRNSSLSQAFAAVVNQEKIVPFNNQVQKANTTKLDKDEVVCSILFEHHPEVPEIDREAINIEKPEEKSVTNDEVDQEIDELRRELGEWNEIEARAIAEGDHVVCDIDALGDAESDKEEESAETTSREVCRDNRFEVKKGSMGTWMLQLLLGKKPGDAVEGVSERDDTIPEGAPFVPTRYRITIKNIVECTPANDERLLETSKAASMEDLHQKVKERLVARNKEERLHILKTNIQHALLETYSFELPNSLVRERGATTMKRTLLNLQEQGLSKKEMEERRKQITHDANMETRARLTLFFLANKHLREKHPNLLDISKKEMVQTYTMKGVLANPGERLIHQDMEPEQMRNELIVEILIERLLRVLAE